MPHILMCNIIIKIYELQRLCPGNNSPKIKKTKHNKVNQLLTDINR